MHRTVRYALLVVCLTLTATATALAQNPQRRWYLAEGATTPFFFEDILIGNPNGVAAHVNITFLKSDGTTVAHAITVGAGTRGTVNVNAVPNVGADAVSAVVDSDVDIVVERTMYFTQANRRGGHTASGVNAPATTWYLAEGATGFFDPFILIANPSATTDAAVRVTFLRASGAPVVYDYVVTRNTRYTIWVNAQIPELANSAFSTVVQSTNGVPIIVERAMYWNNFKGGHSTAGVTSPSTVWRFAEGYTAAGFETFLLLGNPSASAQAQVQVTFLREGATPIVQQYTIEPQQRLDVWVNFIPGLEDAPFSMVVSSNVGIVAERAMYWGNFIEGHASVGLTTEGTKWGFAEGLEHGHFGTFFSTFYLLANSSGQAANVQATFYREDGTGIQRSFTIPPASRYTLIAAAYPELTNQRFAAFFESTNGVPILAERAIYWDQTFYAGTGGTGTPWPGAIVAPVAPPAPTLTGLSPASGPAAGGTTVTLTGTNFGADATVRFGGAPAAVAVLNGATILAVAPAHSAGPVDVVLTSLGATLTLTNAFTYESPAPPPPPSGTPNGPAIATFPASRALPNNGFSDIVRRLAADRPDLIRNSCVETGGNNEFMFEAVRRLRRETGSNRWGLNIKRGFQGLSQDVVTYYFGTGVMEGSTEVFIIDIIVGHCGPNPSPGWGDVTQSTADGGTIGRWTEWGQNLN